MPKKYDAKEKKKYFVIRADVEQRCLDKLDDVENVHLLTGLVKLFFRWGA